MTQFWKPGSLPPKATDKSAVKSCNNATEKSGVQLSKSVMGMKFMKRKEETDLYKATERERLSRLNDKYLSYENLSKENAKDAATYDTSNATQILLSPDAHLSFPGRRSFGGFNRAVEKHYQSIVSGEVDQNSATTITDEEMLQRYEELVGLPRGPNQGKRSNPNSAKGGGLSGKSSSNLQSNGEKHFSNHSNFKKARA